MSIRTHLRASGLVYRLFFRHSPNAHAIPYAPSKTVIPPPSERRPIAASPEAVGMDSQMIAGFLRELERERTAAIHSVAIACRGQLISAASAPGFDHAIRHETLSLCKTVTGLAIGILVGEGRLDIDTPIVKILKNDLPARPSGRMRAVTVRHLLSMTSGVVFAEVGAVTEEDWVRAYLSSAVAFTPGTQFAYNSMNSYMLSVIVERITGSTLFAFATERIFAPLGICGAFWESCPAGHTKGGWGLYLSAEDALKLGEMILDRGAFGGRQIVPCSWITEMARPRSKTPDGMGGYDYGLHLWIAKDGKSLLCNGMLGQNIWISLENRLVLVTTAANAEVFPGPMHDLFRRYFSRSLPRAPKPENEEALHSLRECEAQFRRGRTWTRAHEPHVPLANGYTSAALFDGLTEIKFRAERNNLGILPILITLTQNNLNAGISSLTFTRRGEEFFLLMTEGQDTHRIGIGFSTYEESTLTIRGEHYLVRTRAEFTHDASGTPILKLELLFPELAAVRRLRLYYGEEGTRLVLSERPGQEVLRNLVDVLAASPRGKLLGKLLRPQMDRKAVVRNLRAGFEPTLPLARRKTSQSTAEP